VSSALFLLLTWYWSSLAANTEVDHNKFAFRE
jgi:hypothetical protein